jgi:hypothetical protein
MKIHFLLIFTFFSIFIVSCCNENDTTSGVIISNIDLEDINYSNLDIPDTGCIQTDSSYKALVTEPSLRDNMPYVDFSQQSVLINYKAVNGRIYCDRNVISDSTKKIVTYSVFTKSCRCMDKCKTYDYNIVIVPKIPMGYKLVYK